MTDIVSSIKTDEKGEAVIDLSEMPTGDYSVSASFAQTNQYESKTSSKEYHVFNGYYTRVKINGNSISNSTVITGQYNDNTLLTFSLEYSEDEETWTSKANWSILVNVNGLTYTMTSNQPTLNLSLLNVAEHTTTIQYLGDTNYYPCTYTITYKQTKNTPTLTAENVSYYVDELKEVSVKLSTNSGKGVANIPVSMAKQGNTYTSTTNNEGIATFSSSVSNDPLATSTDTTTYTLDDDTKTIGTLTSNKEYVLQIKNDDSYTLTVGDSLDMTVTGNNLVLADSNIIFYKPYSPDNDNDKIRVTYHNNVFRVVVNDVLVYSHYYTSMNEAVAVEGTCTISLIQLNSLTTGSTINSATVTYSFGGDSNLNSAESITATFTHNELDTTNNLECLIDGYSDDKVPNYWSIYSWTQGIECGYYADGVNHNLQSTYQPYTPAGENLNFHIYSRQNHGCMFYKHITNQVYPLDWFVTDNNTYTGLNINLEPSATSLGHINTLTLTANLGVKGKTIKLYNNNTLVTTGSTGNDGKKVFTIAQPNVGNYNYQAYFEGDNDFEEAGSEIIPVQVYDSVTTLTLSSDKSTYTYPESVVLTADLGVSGKTVKVGSRTATTDSEGIATFTLQNVLPNNYTYTAQFLGDSNYNSCTSNNVQVLINKLTTTTTLGDITTYAKYGESVNILGTTSNVPNGTEVTIEPFGVRTSVSNNSYSISLDENDYDASGKYTVYAVADETSTSKTSTSSSKLVKISPIPDTYTTRYRAANTIYKGQYLIFDVKDSFGDILNNRQMEEGYVVISLQAQGTIGTSSSIPDVNLQYTKNFDNDGFIKLQMNLNYSYSSMTIGASYFLNDMSGGMNSNAYVGTIKYVKSAGGTQTYTH